MNIRTTYEYPPIPIRSMDWSAVDADTYDGDGCPIGRGASELDAIEDLISQLRELDGTEAAALSGSPQVEAGTVERCIEAIKACRPSNPQSDWTDYARTRDEAFNQAILAVAALRPREQEGGKAPVRDERLPAPADIWPLGTHVHIDHDGFSGTVIGHYQRQDNYQGCVLQQDGSKVVHVYGLRHLRMADHPAPLPADGWVAGKTESAQHYRAPVVNAAGQVELDKDKVFWSDDGSIWCHVDNLYDLALPTPPASTEGGK